MYKVEQTNGVNSLASHAAHDPTIVRPALLRCTTLLASYTKKSRLLASK
jgi:hypothetical protein